MRKRIIAFRQRLPTTFANLRVQYVTYQKPLLENPLK